MAVSNYTPNKCKYRIDELDNVVYIVNKESIGGIKVDDGEAYIDGVGYYNAINCLSVSLSESESLDERYEFLHTVNFSVTGYLHWYELNDYYVMLKDKSNTYWLVNPYFKIKYTYTYTLDATSNHTDYVVSTKSNYPLLRVKNFNADNVKPCKTYDYCGVDVMAINETRYSKYVESFDSEIEQYVGRVKYTNDGFKIVNYKKNTCVFTEEFDGKNISHGVKFQVNFDDYKASWHYNLLEFADNKYAVILSTKCGKKVATGFGYGLQPSYTVTADDNQAINNIEIQLSDLHDNGNLLKMPDELPFEHDSATTWNNVEGEYTCIDSTTGVYTLRQEYDIFGNALNNYMCLQGFEDRYASYHIVGTFTDEESFYCPQCRAEECTLQTSLPSNLSFYTTGCKTFSIRSSSDFTIESNTPYITVSPSAGTANQSYSVTVCNSQTPTSTEYIYLLTVTYCSGQTKDYSVTVTEAPVIDCLPNGDEYNVSVYAQDVTIPTNCCIQSVSASCCISNIQIQNGYVKFRIDANNSGSERTITIIFTKCDGTTVTADVIQANYYSRWVYEGSQCNGDEWCALDRMYSGETPDNINTPTYVTRFRDCTASSACATPIYKWENMNPTTDYYCNDCPIQYKWENMNPSTDFYCNNCEIVPQYRWINLDPTVDYYCSGTTKYYKQQQQISTDGGNVWENVSPPQYRRGESAQTQSSDCGYIPTIEYRWIDLDPSVDYYCSGTTKYYKEKKQYSVDSGVTWIDVTPAEYKWGASAETESEDCGYVPSEPMYEWRRITPISGDDSTFVCDSCETLSIKFYATYSDSTSYLAECNSDTTLTSGETRPNGYSYNLMKNVVIGSCVNAIGDKAFYFFSLTSVTILNSVTSIGGSAFENCRSLQSVNIPNSVTTIGNHAFNWCSGMTSCTIGSGVTSIGKYAFSNCRSLKTVTIPDSVTSIGMGAFYASDGLTSINIPSGVTSISEGVFGWCTGLTSIDIPSGVTSIGNEAFKWCNRMTSVTIPTSVTSIGASAFTYCDSLKTITIPSGVTSIGDRAFYDCTSLASITVEATTPPTINSSTFYFTNDCLIYVPCESIAAYKSAWSYYASRIVCIIPPTASTKFVAAYSNSTTFSAICDSDSTLTSATTRPNGYQYTTMTEAIIGNCITIIDGHALSGCSSLSSVTIPDSVTIIGGRAFCDCKNLTSVTIPDSVTTIGDNAFTYCSGITSVTIGSGVTVMGNGAFADCPRLVSITINATTPPIITKYTFSDTNDCPIYVPSESVNTYKTATNWSTYASRIEAISQ